MPGSARALRIGFDVPPKHLFFALRPAVSGHQCDEKFEIARTRSPARETRMLPEELCESLRVSQHFFDGGVACEDAAQAVLAQRDHSELDRLLFDRYRRRAFIDQFTNWVGDS